MPSPSISKTSIANLALQMLGRGKEIANISTDKSEAAAAVRRAYDLTLDLTLEEFEWPFARTRATLGLVANDPTDEWQYSYRWPADCVAPLRIPSGRRRDTEDTFIRYEISSDTQGLLIYSDEANADLVYIKRVTTTSFFPPSFVKAFALRLAMETAAQIHQGKRALRNRLKAEYDEVILKARAVVGNQERRDKEPDADWIRDRT